jgi:DisA bacterial checkpoint controller nucleotide-binding
MSKMQLSGAALRLAAELADDRVALHEFGGLREVLLDELDYARRVPMFEGRRPVYGSMSIPAGTDIRETAGIADLVSLDGMTLETARTFADGRSAFIVHHSDRCPQLVCFDRPVQYEAELVVLQQASGARIVQRSPVRGQVRLFTDGRVVAWNGRSWTDRPTAAALLPSVLSTAPDVDPDVARGLLELTVHWLSPARAGASIVAHESNFDWSSMDTSTKFRAPGLSLKNRQHYPALFASLQQHDLATLVSADGSVEFLGVGLRSSDEAERNTDPEDRGMRHRSAQRFSYDHPSTTIAVVSENGPVTIFRAGRAITLDPATERRQPVMPARQAPAVQPPVLASQRLARQR